MPRQSWEQTRARGKWSFVWRAGVLAWGLTSAFIWSAVMAWGDGWSLQAFLWHFRLAVIGFPLGGILFGLFVWWWSERNYRRQSP